MLLSFLWFLISHFLQVFVSVAKYQPGGLLSWEFSNGLSRVVLPGRWKLCNLRMMRSVKIGQLQGELGAREAKSRQLLPAESHYGKDPLPSRIITWQ